MPINSPFCKNKQESVLQQVLHMVKLLVYKLHWGPCPTFPGVQNCTEVHVCLAPESRIFCAHNVLKSVLRICTFLGI